MITSAQEVLKFEPEIKVAIIYSIPEVNAFLVELYYQGENSYISENSQPIKFRSLPLAKKAAYQQGATQGYQAFENVYQDVGTTTKDGEVANNRFEYLPTELD